jgi:tetratricopeptide (TPR) repeat protein
VGETGNGGTGEERDAHTGTHSEVSGVVLGSSLQARDIHGDIHLYQPAARIPRPSQLPPAPHLVGRSRELAVLESAREDRAVVISGPAGIGKTALALHWAHGLRAGYPDGALYADLHGHAPDGPAVPGEILVRFLRALGTSPQQVPAGLAEQTALYRSVTADRNLLVMLDDALTAAQVRPLLPASVAGLTVITSRWRLAGLRPQGARLIQLGRLTPEAALELLAQTMGDDRIRGEPEAARELVHLCARLPLAVCVAGARLAARPRWPIREMADALSQEHRRLAVLTMDSDTAVGASLDLSYRALPAAEARLYRLMGLHPGTAFDSGVAAATAAIPGLEARQLLGLLADANLLDDAAGGRYRFHDLTRLHARERAEHDETGPARQIAIRRMLDWFLATVTNAGERAMPYRHDQPRDVQYRPAEQARFASPEDALDWLDRELPSVLAATRFAAAQGLHALAWQLTDALWPLFLYRGHYAERIEADISGLASARACADPVGEAKMLNRVGLALRDIGQPDQAAEQFRQALSIWRRLHDDHRVAGSLRRLGFVSVDMRHLDEAIGFFSDALDLYRALGDERHIALTLSDLGAALTRAARPGEAVRHLREAVSLLRGVPDRFSMARVLSRMGTAQAQAGDLADASATLGRAVTIMRETGSPPGEADILVALGDLAERAAQPAEARRRYEEALTIFTRLGAPRAARIRARLEQLRAVG